MKKYRGKVIASFFTLLAVLWGQSQTVFAENIYAKAAAEWVLDGLFWLILVLMLAVAGFAAVKRNLSGALTTILVGAILLGLIKNPTALETLGTSLRTIVGL